MTLYDKHIALVRAVNEARTNTQHQTAGDYLRAWRDGVQATGIHLDLIGADLYYIDQGCDRPMCCGVWLDWAPADEKETPYAD